MSKKARMRKRHSLRVMDVIKRMAHEFGKPYRERIVNGVGWVAAFWQPSDGTAKEFSDFCMKNFLTDEAEREALLKAVGEKMEQISGSNLETFRLMHRPIHVETGVPVSRYDKLFAGINPFTSKGEMLFDAKIAFVILLNFKCYPGEELLAREDKMTRRDWLETRAVDAVRGRTPVRIERKILDASLACENYISGYYFHIHRILDADGNPYFNEPKRLISHWGLRDELKGQYGEPGGEHRQAMLYEVMKRVISQRVPKEIIDNPDITWQLENNKTRVAETGELIESEPESDTRYEHCRQIFLMEKAADRHYGRSFIERSFIDGCEIPEGAVRVLIDEILKSPLAQETAAVVRKLLGRELKSYDMWFNRFVSHDAKAFDPIIRAKYPTAESFEADIPNILRQLGFESEKADFVGSQIKVEVARSSGHAWGAIRRGDKSLLRTRCEPTGMNYQNYEVSLHELGHCVEQVMALNFSDNIFLADLPNSAFSEAFAFYFEKRLLDLLGVTGHAELEDEFLTLHRFWDAFHICGVALLDIRIWNWLYGYANLSAEDIKNGVRRIARDVWNRYFAPVIGTRNDDILAIYSHIINYPLYIPNYAVGEIASFQILDFCRGKHWPTEMERMCRIGYVTPNVWMKAAVGSPLSLEPMFRLTKEALQKINAK